MNKLSKYFISWRRLAAIAATSGATFGQTADTVSELPDNAVEQPIAVDLKQIAEQMTHKDILVKIIDLLENKEWSDSELENMLMEFRYDIADAKTFYLDSISAIDSALQLGQSSVQMAFTVSANTVFNSMSERIYSAEREFQTCVEEIKQVEDKFTKLLADTLKKSKNDVDLVK